MPELGKFVPVQILFDDGTLLAHVGIVTQSRSDGCHELTFPQATCILTRGGHPRNKWPKAEGINEAKDMSPLASKELMVSEPLMPRRRTRARKQR